MGEPTGADQQLQRIACSITGKLPGQTAGTATQGESRTIYRVPPNIQQANRKFYRPQMLSIGPFHRGRVPQLMGMEADKLRYLQHLILRSSQTVAPAVSDPPHDHQGGSGTTSLIDSNNAKMRQCIRKMQESEGQARSCYSETIPGGSGVFVEMLVLDGCFLLELLFKFYKKEERKNDPIFAVGGLLPLIRCDILKLENQIPFSILEHLFDILLKNNAGSGGVPALKTLAFQYLMRREASPDELARLGNATIHHLLHLYDLILMPPAARAAGTTDEAPPKNTMNPCASCSNVLPSWIRSSTPAAKRTRTTIPCAVELKEAGVKLRKTPAAETFLDVTFAGSKLRIPPLPMDGSTNSIFRNLVAFGQCCPGVGDHFTAYVFFLDCIVNTPGDVAILQDRGIIENKLGSEEKAAQLINRLCEEVTINYRSHYLAGLFREVNEYADKTCNRHWAKFMRDYFGTPWSFISLMAAIALLGMTLIQTIYSVRSYNK